MVWLIALSSAGRTLANAKIAKRYAADILKPGD